MGGSTRVSDLARARFSPPCFFLFHPPFVERIHFHTVFMVCNYKVFECNFLIGGGVKTVSFLHAN